MKQPVRITDDVWQTGLVYELDLPAVAKELGITVIWQCAPGVIPHSSQYRVVYTPFEDDSGVFSFAAGARLWRTLVTTARGLVGERVLTVCHAGQNRSGLASALLLVAKLGCTGAEAVQQVRQAASKSDLIYWTDELLWNREFAQAVRESFPRPYMLSPTVGNQGDRIC